MPGHTWRIGLVRARRPSRESRPALPWWLAACTAAAGFGAVFALAASAPARAQQGAAAHQAPVQPGRPVPAIHIGATWSLAGPTNVRMGGLGETLRVTVTREMAVHGGSVYCAVICEVRPLPDALLVGIDAGGRLTVRGDWTPPAGAELRFSAGASALPRAGGGLLVVTGQLSAAPGGTLVTVAGAPARLPVPLIQAHAITGTWIAGSLPPGTALSYAPGRITLVEAP